MNLEEVQPGLYQSTEPSRRVDNIQQYVERVLSHDDPPYLMQFADVVTPRCSACAQKMAPRSASGSSHPFG